jgi:hypothetical protein
MERALMLLLDTNILIDVLRGEVLALAWLEGQTAALHQRDHLDRGARWLPRGRIQPCARLAGELSAPGAG